MSLIPQEALPQVAMEFMNDVHTEDVDIINNLHALVVEYKNSKSEELAKSIDTHYEEWYEHTLNHFSGEEVKMLELNFPPYQMHKSEHEKALAQMETVYREWREKRDISVLDHYLSQEIPAWLTNHIQTMDTVTAMFFKQQLS